MRTHTHRSRRFRSSVRTTSGLVAVATGAALLLAACGTPEVASDSPTPAEDRTLVLYSGRDESLIGPLIEQFEQASDISVEVRYAGTTELAAQLLEEGDRTPAQVFLSQDAGALGALGDAGLLAPMPEDISSQVDAQYTSKDGSWVGLTGRARVIVYDGEEFSSDEVPTETSAVTDAKWKGQVGIAPANASFQSFVTALRVLEGEQAAEDWLVALNANEPQIFEKNGAILEAVNTGALDLGLINHYYWFEAAAELGADKMRAKLQYGKAGTPSALVNVSGAGILAGSADSAEATELVSWLVGADAQAYFVEQTHEYSLIPGAAGPEGAPALADLAGPDLDLSELATLEQTVALLQKVGLV